MIVPMKNRFLIRDLPLLVDAHKEAVNLNVLKQGPVLPRYGQANFGVGHERP